MYNVDIMDEGKRKILKPEFVKEKPYDGVGMEPRVRAELVVRAQEIEDIIRLKVGEERFLTLRDLIPQHMSEWEGKDEQDLLADGYRYTQKQWLQSPVTYLALVEAMRKKSDEK